MKISKSEVFLKVLEFGSLSGAADYCNYSQAAVSQIISSMENELGLVLLNRNHSGVELTSEGKQLLPYLSNLSRAHVELTEKASELKGVEGGLIRIGTFSSFSCHLLVPILKGFKSLHPNIRFELHNAADFEEIEGWILKGMVDFGFVDLPTMKEFEVIPVIEDRMLAVLPSGHPYADAPSVPLKIFEEEPMILMVEGTKKEVLAMFHKYRIKPRVEYITEDDYTIMSMVENGLGISVLAELIMQKTGYDIVKKETTPAFSRKIGAALKSRQKASLAVRTFLTYLENCVDEGIGKPAVLA